MVWKAFPVGCSELIGFLLSWGEGEKVFWSIRPCSSSLIRFSHLTMFSFQEITQSTWQIQVWKPTQVDIHFHSSIDKRHVTKSCLIWEFFQARKFAAVFKSIRLVLQFVQICWDLWLTYRTVNLCGIPFVRTRWSDHSASWTDIWLTPISSLNNKINISY